MEIKNGDRVKVVELLSGIDDNSGLEIGDIGTVIEVIKLTYEDETVLKIKFDKRLIKDDRNANSLDFNIYQMYIDQVELSE